MQRLPGGPRGAWYPQALHGLESGTDALPGRRLTSFSPENKGRHTAPRTHVAAHQASN